MEYNYTTIKNNSEGIFKDRGSKFISFACQVNSESEAKERITSFKKEYHDARHHCYAWRIGINPPSVRANDDGEPSNSAGKPILNQIEKYNLTNIVIVVIRYFGGTLLGVGGLINAYRTAAEDAIKNSNFIKKDLLCTYKISFEYQLMNNVMKILKENNIESYNHQFELSCSLMFNVKLINELSVQEKFNLLEGCKIEKTGTNNY